MRLVPIYNRILPAVLLLICCCCTPTARYKTLKIFFDGVPDPEAKKPAVTVAAPVQQASPAKKQTVITVVSQHKDYQEKNCSRCHDRTSGNFLASDKQGICFICHQREDYNGEFVHGPVAVSACLSCHLPHNSKFPKLLKAVGAELCFKCHRPDELSGSETHDLDPERDCTACHLPHAADNRFFCKERY